MSGRLAARWLLAPMQIGAFDQPERDECDDPDAHEFNGDTDAEGMDVDKVA